MQPQPRLPLIELHEHLDGSLRVPTILDLARQQNVKLPSTDEDVLRSILVPGQASLEVYLQAFGVTVSVMQTAEALTRVAREQVEDWARDGVVYGEIRFAPELHTQGGLNLNQVVEAVLSGLNQGARSTGVEFGLILSQMRSSRPCLDIVKLVKNYRQSGVVGFDIAGAETPFPSQLHQEAYDYAATELLNTTCHAGEVTDPGYIREALLSCRSLRIGHGTQLIQEWHGGVDPGPGSLTAWIRDRQIPLEMCLTSNVQTHAVASVKDHPFDLLRRSGVRVCLCTDNRLVSDTSLSHEVALARATWDLSDGELLDIQKRTLETAFCPWEQRQRLLAKYFS